MYVVSRPIHVLSSFIIVSFRQVSQLQCIIMLNYDVLTCPVHSVADCSSWHHVKNTKSVSHLLVILTGGLTLTTCTCINSTEGDRMIILLQTVSLQAHNTTKAMMVLLCIWYYYGFEFQFAFCNKI